MLSREQPGQFPQITVPVELEKWPPIRSAMAKPKTTRASRMMMMSLICMIVPPAGSRQQSVTLSRYAPSGRSRSGKTRPRDLLHLGQLLAHAPLGADAVASCDCVVIRVS